MVGFFRKAGSVSDARPPGMPRSRPALGACERCGHEVLEGEGLDFSDGRSHFVCDAAIRDAVERKVEAMRALHRATTALAGVPDVRTTLEGEIARLPDAIEVSDAIRVLERARVLVECTAIDKPERRRLALSYLDAMLRKLGAP